MAISIVGIEIIILILLLFYCCLKDEWVMDKKITDWSSRTASYDNGWACTPDKSGGATEESPIDFIFGPYMQIPQGTYTVTIEYENDNKQKCVIRASGENNNYIKTSEIVLNPHYNKISCDFEITKDINNLEIVVKYTGNGNINIKNIEVVENNNNIFKAILILLTIFCVGDLCLFTDFFNCENGKYRVAIFIVSGLISLPLACKGISMGHDLMFHCIRIEGIAEALKNHVFPVRIQSLWYDGYGYPVSIFYGDLFLYIPALLRCGGLSIIEAYKVYIILINIGTVIVSYYCFSKMFLDKKIGLLCAVAYSGAIYRLVDIYVRIAVGEYTAIMFFPIIAYSMWRITNKEPKFHNTVWLNSIILAIGMTGLIESHILSTEMVIVILTIYCIAMIKRIFRLNSIKALALAVVETIFLNLWFIVPFIDYWMNVPVSIFSNSKNIHFIQSSGVYFLQYFAVFCNYFGSSTEQINGRLGMTPGLLLMAVLILAIYMFIKKRLNYGGKICVLFSIVVMFIGSYNFPWDYLSSRIGLFNSLSEIQFVWRHIAILQLFLSILLGYVLIELKDREIITDIFNWKIDISWAEKMTVILSIISIIVFWGVYVDNFNMNTLENPTQLQCVVSTVQYLRTDTKKELFQYDVLTDNVDEAKIVEREGCKIKTYCKTNNAGTIVLPMVNYKGYRAFDDYGNEYMISDSDNNLIQINIPADFEGNIIVDFYEPVYWRISEIVSLLSVISVICAFIFVSKKYKREGVD